jgi:hypothetical protein
VCVEAREWLHLRVLAAALGVPPEALEEWALWNDIARALPKESWWSSLLVIVYLALLLGGLCLLLVLHVALKHWRRRRTNGLRITRAPRMADTKEARPPEEETIDRAQRGAVDGWHPLAELGAAAAQLGAAGRDDEAGGIISLSGNRRETRAVVSPGPREFKSFWSRKSGLKPHGSPGRNQNNQKNQNRTREGYGR